MPKVSEEHRNAMRQRIRHATVTLLATKGMRAMSMSDLLKEAGMSAGAFYGYYGSKEEALADAARDVLARKREQVRLLRERKPLPEPAEVLIAVFGTPLDGAPPPPVLQIWSEAQTHPDMAALATEGMRTMRDELAAYFTDWLTHQGLDPATSTARSTALVPALVGLAQGHLVHHALFDQQDADAYDQALTTLCGILAVGLRTEVDGVQPQPSS